MHARSRGSLGLAAAGLLLAGWLLGSMLTPPVARTQARVEERALALADTPPTVTPFTLARAAPAVARPTSRRNPFAFGGSSEPAPAAAPRAPLTAASDDPSEAPASAVVDSGPSWTLAGVATDAQDGVTAVVTGDGGVHLVRAGDRLPGGVEVVTVDAAEVHLRGADGAVLVLRLR